MIRDDGGSAFAFSETLLSVSGNTKSEQVIAKGMSLRDYFAAAALTGNLANDMAYITHTAHAVDAYAIADAMLEERKK